MTKSAVEKIYKQCGLKPSDAQVIELHDCFSANELVTYEALGLCPEGIFLMHDVLDNLFSMSKSLYLAEEIYVAKVQLPCKL